MIQPVVVIRLSNDFYLFKLTDCRWYRHKVLVLAGFQHLVLQTQMELVSDNEGNELNENLRMQRIAGLDAEAFVSQI